MVVAERKSDFKLTTDTPYLALIGELWGVCCKDIGENLERYNGIALYLEGMASHINSFYTCDCLMANIGHLIKPTAMGKWYVFPPKIHSFIS